MKIKKPGKMAKSIRRKIKNKKTKKLEVFIGLEAEREGGGK